MIPFLTISTKGRYGLLLMIDLGMAGTQGPVSLKSIAERKGLSDHYLEQLIAPLRNAGLVKSVRGAYGGYLLSRLPDEITAGDVLTVLEGPFTVVEAGAEDGLDEFWTRLRHSVEEVFATTTIADLIAMWGKNNPGTLMFYI